LNASINPTFVSLHIHRHPPEFAHQLVGFLDGWADTMARTIKLLTAIEVARIKAPGMHLVALFRFRA